LGYGYAHTIHKSQGGTYARVFVLEDTIKRFNDKQIEQQLKYVAMSRATDCVYVYTT
jgi:ATP-dependent exoDNAse (exonuclease V) alpha subunit